MPSNGFSVACAIRVLGGYSATEYILSSEWMRTRTFAHIYVIHLHKCNAAGDPFATSRIPCLVERVTRLRLVEAGLKALAHYFLIRSFDTTVERCEPPIGVGAGQDREKHIFISSVQVSALSTRVYSPTAHVALTIGRDSLVLPPASAAADVRDLQVEPRNDAAACGNTFRYPILFECNMIVRQSPLTCLPVAKLTHQEHISPLF
ncbi:uncharacterized protein TRIVIDRAFT_68837 [Trichoderma virens Gv29-8]|uniref:Uncharacterized protein n=1 Tax=Hypocrea virens (strain Gv29-8 / FGSC 10586) TaxID=413071 RepID=G9MZ46_HYPVG|nr:uncharacterized protein TRIVIDRAFT_68837 [Trichoderma virens Gv29-8]EHK20373.1 hypothetical protein TRIVIDRAFT_68837 [Trichoderma virens Gv29-8]